MEKRLEKLGFKTLFILQVPMGTVLNSETADLFSLIDSKGYIHENGHNIVPAVEEGLYYLVPPEPKGEYVEQEVYNGAHKLEEIISYFESSNLKI